MPNLRRLPTHNKTLLECANWCASSAGPSLPPAEVVRMSFAAPLELLGLDAHEVELNWARERRAAAAAAGGGSGGSGLALGAVGWNAATGAFEVRP